VRDIHCGFAINLAENQDDELGAFHFHNSFSGSTQLRLVIELSYLQTCLLRSVWSLRIVTYDEVDPEQALMISLFCLGWPMTPQTVRYLRKYDRRYSTYYGLYALNDEGRAVSQVLVLHIQTRTKNGKELVGGIQGVGTLPGYSRHGYSTALMKRAHELLGESGIRISFLLTSASLVAHEMYEKLGYSTIAAFNRALRSVEPTHQKRLLTLKRYEPKYATALDRLFARQTESALGFVYRQPKYLTIGTKAYPSLAEKISVAVAADRVVGYVCANSESGCANIEELVAVDDEARKSILWELERKFKLKYLSLGSLMDSKLTRFYEQEGFSIQGPGWGRVRAAGIDRSLSGRDIADLYGVNEGCFVLYSVDNF
jgi:GNAT superfamily N-acetyltransferase